MAKRKQLPIFDKTPAEILRYIWDWTEELDGANIASSSLAIEAISGDGSPVVIDSDTDTLKKATTYMSGGSIKNEYTMTDTMITDHVPPQTIIRSAYLRIVAVR